MAYFQRRNADATSYWGGEVKILIANLTDMTELVSALGVMNPDVPRYPVLGAEGPEFFVDICTGPMPSRSILNTLHIEFSLEVPETPWKAPEYLTKALTIRLPDPSFMVALLALLGGALGNGLEVMHPLDACGNYFDGCAECVKAFSDKQL